MVVVKQIVLDVLKPHLPNALDFCYEIARLQKHYQVSLTVVEMDEKFRLCDCVSKADEWIRAFML